jgi:hypothetical protein
VNDEQSKALREVTQQELDNIIEAQTRYLHHCRPNEGPSLANCKLSELIVPEGTDFEQMDFRGCEISSLTLKGCKFGHCDFSNSTLRATFLECEFSPDPAARVTPTENPRLLDVGRRIPARDRFAPDSPVE